jgi:hypothetical protein
LLFCGKSITKTAFYVKEIMTRNNDHKNGIGVC